MSRCPKCGAGVSEENPYDYACGSGWEMNLGIRGVFIDGVDCLRTQNERLREALEPFAAVGRIVRDEGATVFDAEEETDLRHYPGKWIVAADALVAGGPLLAQTEKGKP